MRCSLSRNYAALARPALPEFLGRELERKQIGCLGTVHDAAPQRPGADLGTVNGIFTTNLDPRVEHACETLQHTLKLRICMIDIWKRPAPMVDKEQRIREIAYRLWEEDGRPIGQADRHWQMATKLADQGEQTTSASARVVDIRPKKKRRLRLVA
jgi:Protein of unknown function (DUF2934)